MSHLAEFIKRKTPKFNKTMVEGLCYHRINKALSYIDNFIKYNNDKKTSTYLKYLGYRVVDPKEEIKMLMSKTGKIEYDIAENDIFLVEFRFQYHNEPTERKYYFYVPYFHPGNIIRLSGNNFLVMPILADKVISIGEKIIFINILTAKYNFERIYYTVVMDSTYKRVPVIITELYKNQSKKLPDTTKAKTTVMHYLLANEGYSSLAKRMLGFVPQPVYDHKDQDDNYHIIESTGVKPNGYIQHISTYEKSRIKFLVPKDKYTEDVLYFLSNIFYIIDHFPKNIFIDNLDDTTVWKKCLAEIIHSGNHGIAYLMEKINAHFYDLRSEFDVVTEKKLKDINVQASNLIELLFVIFINFNKWIMSSSPRSLYYNKTYEVESFVLSHLTSRITRIFLDINKEELKNNMQPIESKTVDKIFKKYFVTRAIFNLKKEKNYVTSIEYPGDHLYPKNSAMVVVQESDFVNIQDTDINTSEKKKIVASMATIGSILGLSKKNPVPLIRLNPYVNVDEATGTVLPHPLFNDIVEKTDRLLNNIVLQEDIEDTSEYDADILNEEDVDEDYDGSDMELDDDNFMENIDID